MNLLIKSATIIDKNSEFHNQIVDILIEKGIILNIGTDLKNSKTLKKLNLITYMSHVDGLIIS